MPVDGEGDRSIAEHAEIEGVVRVFPDVVAAEYQVFPKSLLQTGMKFVAKAWLLDSRDTGGAKQQRSQHRIRASVTGEHQIFVEWSLQRASIGDAKHRVA